jgi:hypothetical protein
MKKWIFISLFSIGILPAPAQPGVSVIDFVKIKNDKTKEALFFYENNWKVYRDSALQKKYISAYRLLTTNADSMGNFDIMLITEYADRAQFQLSEQRFNQIIKTVRPDGPKLLNDLKPDDFRKHVFTKKNEIRCKES